MTDTKRLMDSHEAALHAMKPLRRKIAKLRPDWPSPIYSHKMKKAVKEGKQATLDMLAEKGNEN